jgi:hypothetical protein
VKDLSLSNAAQIAPMAAGGIVGGMVKGIPGLMLGFAGGEFPVDYAVTLLDYMQDQGVNLQDYKAVDEKLREPAFLDGLRTFAGRHATGVAVGDAAAGKLMRPIAGGVGKAVAAAASNTAVGIAGESGGEALGELMSPARSNPARSSPRAWLPARWSPLDPRRRRWRGRARRRARHPQQLRSLFRPKKCSAPRRRPELLRRSAPRAP